MNRLGISALILLQAYFLWLGFWPHHSKHNWIVASNDGPLGQIANEKCALPGAMSGIWDDSNGIGIAAPAYSPAPSIAIRGVPGLVYLMPSFFLFYWWIVERGWLRWLLVGWCSVFGWSLIIYGIFRPVWLEMIPALAGGILLGAMLMLAHLETMHNQ